jgi:hypothetical protein
MVMQRFYIDCEFDGHNGPLLSMAIVTDHSDGIHIRTTARAADEWVAANVEPVMHFHRAPEAALVRPAQVGRVVRAFMGDMDGATIIADSPVDITRFCQAISTDSDGNWASVDGNLTFEVHNVDCYPTDLPGAVQHNAWWDAMALRHKLSSTTPTTGI